jgi:regulatory protein
MDNPYYEKLVNSAIRFVSFRPRSEKELRDFLTKKLTKWAVSGEVLLEKVIARMGELGYVDDEKFAAWWVDQRTSFKPKGNRLIKMELSAKGVPVAIISSILASRGSESLVEAAKRAVGRKRFKTPQHFYNYLARRGFDADTISRVKYEQ